ncbi:MAG: hypothetical protein XD37_1899 [Thermoanaerobacter thermocopriae]|nr:MAG: hypothetical protein XD37_1899 [Thermoanaerobacter thermocopriae]
MILFYYERFNVITNSMIVMNYQSSIEKVCQKRITLIAEYLF